MAADDHPVHRHFVAGADEEKVARLDRLDGDQAFGPLRVARVDKPGLSRSQGSEGPEGFPGSALRPRLEPTSHQDKGDDDGHHVEVQMATEFAARAADGVVMSAGGTGQELNRRIDEG